MVAKAHTWARRGAVLSGGGADPRPACPGALSPCAAGAHAASDSQRQALHARSRWFGAQRFVLPGNSLAAVCVCVCDRVLLVVFRGLWPRRGRLVRRSSVRPAGRSVVAGGARGGVLRPRCDGTVETTAASGLPASSPLPLCSSSLSPSVVRASAPLACYRRAPRGFSAQVGCLRPDPGCC